MAKGRDNAADSLGDLLELIRVRRQSGSLSVERFQGGRFEEGEIYFQGGQPTYAHAGQMTGQEALTWMLSWNKVFFSFTLEETRLTATISSATSANSSNAISTNVPTAPFSTKYPSPNASGMPPTTPSSLPQVTSKEPSGNFDGPFESADPQSASGTPGLEWLVPQKLGKDRDVLSLPLTRPQRSIYLLVDGRRTISDLSRCTRKSTQEIERLLSELREHGLIAV